MSNLLTPDLEGAEFIEKVIANEQQIGTIVKREGHYYFVPVQEYYIVLGKNAAVKIAQRLTELEVGAWPSQLN